MRAGDATFFCRAKMRLPLRVAEKRRLRYTRCRGEVSERLKEPASKAGSLAKPGSWVQIPPSPPIYREDRAWDFVFSRCARGVLVKSHPLRQFIGKIEPGT